MKIRKISLKNYRCFEQIEMDFHDRLTVIVGNNGAGKTSVLEGTAIALGTVFTALDGLNGMSISKRDAHLKAYQMGRTDDVQAQYPVEIEAEGVLDQKEVIWKRCLNGSDGNTTIRDAKQILDIVREYQERLRTGDQKLILPIIAYYGTGRLWDYHREKKTDTFKENTKTNGYIDSLDGTANIKLMMNWFRKKSIQMFQQSVAGVDPMLELSAVYQAMESCFERSTGYKNIRLVYNFDTNEIDCCYVGDDGVSARVPLSQMSDGYKGTISLVADIAYRMAVLNPQLGENVLKNTDGIVLVDEIDLHLHPAWQHRILSDLMEIFPKVQFIVTTHAPAVISSVKSENLVILKNYEAMDAFAEIYGNDVNSILKNIMGVSDRNPAVARLFEQFDSALNAGRYDDAEKVLDEIDEQRDFHDKEATADRVKLRLERIRGRKND